MFATIYWKSVLLLTFLLSILLCYQHYSALLSIWLTVVLLLLNIVGPHSKVMIHKTNTPQWILPNF